ncbi:MAG: helix-turn-helix transcriptional regulator [Oscillospiraceae bacterium]|nr:helix-turn-helix transcriptional regulator [Oscillospiraceae bacterium]
MTFHEKLQSIRKSSGMTQTELAEKLNVSRQAVSRWEMGSAMPDIENLIAISELFGVALDDLLKADRISVNEPEPSMEAEDLVQDEPAQPKKSSNKIWWIIWAVSVTVALAVPLINMYLQRENTLFAINPATAVAQIVNLALTLGIVVLLIRWLCKKRE